MCLEFPAAERFHVNIPVVVHMYTRYECGQWLHGFVLPEMCESCQLSFLSVILHQWILHFDITCHILAKALKQLCFGGLPYGIPISKKKWEMFKAKHGESSQQTAGLSTGNSHLLSLPPWSACQTRITGMKGPCEDWIQLYGCFLCSETMAWQWGQEIPFHGCSCVQLTVRQLFWTR